MYDDSEFSQMELLYLQGLETGMLPLAAMRFAGYANPSKSLKDLRARRHVAQAEAAIQAMLAEARNITRERVQDILLEAVDMARMQGDPMTLVRVANEFNKMNGYHAPEQKVIKLSANAEDAKRMIDNMTEEQMLELIGEESLDVEFEEIDDDPDAVELKKQG